MKIYNVAEPDLTGNEAKYVMDAIMNEKRVSSSGKYIEKFENQIKKYCGRKYALACSNGTTALHLALLGLGIGKGDEVIVPVLTFAASAGAVVHAGATPVFIDSCSSDWNLDEKLLDKVVTKKTKALIAVDLYGVPCNYKKIEAWCRRKKIHLIEDCAEGMGGSYHKKKLGNFGKVSCFSFFGNKNITTGEGGMCLTDDPKIYERMKVYKNHGMESAGTYHTYHHIVVGYNYRMTNLQAAVGVAQFERLPKFMKIRRHHDKLYRSMLDSKVKCQKIEMDSVSAFWLFSATTKKDADFIRKALKEKGIETRSIFKPLNLQPGYAKFAKNKSFLVAEEIWQRGFSLPSSTLLSDDDIKFIASELLALL